VTKPEGAMKVTGRRGGSKRLPCTINRSLDMLEGFEWEHTCKDPKDSELCVYRVKPEEILVEARSGTDVQIVRQICV